MCLAALSGYNLHLDARSPNGTTDVDRPSSFAEGKNLKGHVLAGVLGTVGKKRVTQGVSSTASKPSKRRNDASVA